MSGHTPQVKRILQEGILLGADGDKVGDGLWEEGVYLSADKFIYHVVTQLAKDEWQTTIAGKRSVGEYLRWVDGLFRPGELPDGSNAIHYRAARKLRELL